MKVLIDSHILVWWAHDRPLPSRRLRQILQDPSNQLLFSVASAWELAIKTDRLGFKERFESVLRIAIQELGLIILGIELRHVLHSASLPLLHRDPFDRVLISQAILEGVPILSVDQKIKQYPVEVIS